MTRFQLIQQSHRYKNVLQTCKIIKTKNNFNDLTQNKWTTN